MTTGKLLLLTLVMLGFFSQIQAARLYKWVDEYGSVTYRDHPPLDGKYKVETRDYGVKDESTQIAAEELRAVALQYPITLYMTDKCASCDLLRNYLKGKKVPFKEKNVAGDLKVQEELKGIVGELVVPALTIGKEVVRGFSRSTLDGRLKAVGYIRAPEPAEDEDEGFGSESPEPEEPEEPTGDNR